MKYIIVKSHDLELAIVFERHVVSAGMCNASGTAWGKSLTLGLDSRPEDTAIIQKTMKRTL